MKRTKRIIALILSLTLLLGLFSGCGKVAKADAYMTKGEFMLLFASETGLTASESPEVKLDLDEKNKYYSAAVALVEIGHITPEEAVEDINKAVTKEFVATVCVKNLYFRDTFDTLIKDEVKLKDPQACKDAVGHGIVSLTDNGYFKAYQKMTYEECQYAIDTMMHIDATSSFKAGEAEVEVVLKEGVIDITEEYDDTTLQPVDPTDPDFEEIIRGMSTEVKEDEPTEVSCSDEENCITLFSNEEISIPLEEGGQTPVVSSTYGTVPYTSIVDGKNYCTLDEADEGALVVIRVQSFVNSSVATSRNLPRLKVGDMIAYGLHTHDIYNYEKLKKYSYTFYGEIVAINDEEPATPLGRFIYYTIRIPSQEEVLEQAKLNRYNSAANGTKWEFEQLTDNHAGINVGPLEVNRDSLKIKISKTVSNEVDSWRDEKFEVDLDYEFEVKDISLDIDGFGKILTGNIDNAICQVKYTVVNKFGAESGIRFTPDDNRNGKFLNNLTRARATGQNAAGATGIKIARLYANLPWGFFVEIYVYATVQIDGSIQITLTTECANGFKVINNKAQVINYKKNDLTIDANAIINVGLHADVMLKWGLKNSKAWADANFAVGLLFAADATVEIINEDGECVESGSGYISTEELREIEKEAEVKSCVDLTVSWYYSIVAVTDQSRIGKIVKYFNDGYTGLKLGKTNPIGRFHWDDGKKVSKCTKGDEQAVAEVEEKTGELDTFELTQYKVLIPEYTCGFVLITGYPVDKEDLDDMGGITVSVLDTNVATAHMSGNGIVIEAVGEGSTQLVIETRNKRFRQECSVTVEKNDY